MRGLGGRMGGLALGGLTLAVGLVLAGCSGPGSGRDLATLEVRDSLYMDAENDRAWTGPVYRDFPDTTGRQLEGRLREGRFQGELTVWHRDGRIRYQGRLHRGRPCGAWLENRESEPGGSLYEELVQDIESMGLYPACPDDPDAPPLELPEDSSPAWSWAVQHRDSAALFVGLHAVDDTTVWVAGHGGRVGRTVDGGASWRVEVVPGADSLGFRDVHAFSAEEAFVLSIGAGEASRIYRTRDGGVRWTEVFRNRDPQAFFDCLSFWDRRRGFAFSDAVDGEFVLLRTEDGGDRWERVDPDDVPDARPGEGSFAASGSCVRTAEGGVGWFGTGASGVDTRVFRTTDYGRSWTATRTPIRSEAPDEGLTSLSFLDAERGWAFGGLTLDSAVNVVETRDGGRSWEVVASGVLDGTVYGSSVVPGTSGPTLVAVSPAGTAVSRDGGRSWSVVDTTEYWTVDVLHPGAGWAAGRGVIARREVP